MIKIRRPVQKYDIPRKVLEKAKELDVEIRDVKGNLDNVTNFIIYCYTSTYIHSVYAN